MQTNFSSKAFSTNATEAFTNSFKKIAIIMGVFFCLTNINAKAAISSASGHASLNSVDSASGSCRAGFSFNVSGGLSVQFYDSSFAAAGDSISSAKWTFGDGDSSSYFNPAHTYTTGGYYTVCVTITTYKGCTSSNCGRIYLTGPNTCSAGFTYVDTGNTVQFTNTSTSTDSIVSYEWYFGDGDSINSVNPSHTYSTSNNYTVCLYINAVNGCSSNDCANIPVGPLTGCTASFYTTPDTGFTNTFQFHSTSTSKDTIVQYHWAFGDGDTSDLASPNHTYTTFGVEMACLTITSKGGCTASKCDSVNAGSCNASFYSYPGGGNSVSFYSQSTSADSIVSYSWNFGDGTTSSSYNPTHIYSSIGVYTVCLTINSINGCSSTSCQSVSVSLSCNAAISYITYPGDSVHFTSTSTSNDTIVRYHWSFGDGDTSANFDPWHTYSTSGYYLACLTIYTHKGCSSSACDSMNIGGGSGTVYDSIYGYVSCDSTAAYPATVYLIQYGTDSSGNGTLTEVSQTSTNSNGNYTFANIASGSYLVKAALDSMASNYSSCLPTYSVSTLYWDSGAVYYNGNTNKYAPIHLISGSNPGGPGFIGGLVSKGADGPRGITGLKPYPNVEVLLLNTNGHALEAKFTNDSGQYLFSSLAYGTYELEVEYPGKTSQIATVTISSSNPSSDGVDFTVLSTYVATGVQNVVPNPVSGVGEIYPNPTDNIANLQVQLNASANLVISIKNLLGQEVYTYTQHLSTGSTMLNIPTTELQSGVYFVELRADDATIIVRKLIKE